MLWNTILPASAGRHDMVGGPMKSRTVSSKQHKWRGSWCPIYQVAMSHLSSLMANIHFFSTEFLLSKLYNHSIATRLQTWACKEEYRYFQNVQKTRRQCSCLLLFFLFSKVVGWNHFEFKTILHFLTFSRKNWNHFCMVTQNFDNDYWYTAKSYLIFSPLEKELLILL